MIVLEGPREERTNEEARAGIRMNASQVRFYIDQMERKTKQKSARIRMAQLAIKHGFVTPEGKDVWREYLARLTA